MEIICSIHNVVDLELIKIVLKRKFPLTKSRLLEINYRCLDPNDSYNPSLFLREFSAISQVVSALRSNGRCYTKSVRGTLQNKKQYFLVPNSSHRGINKYILKKSMFKIFKMPKQGDGIEKLTARNDCKQDAMDFFPFLFPVVMNWNKKRLRKIKYFTSVCHCFQNF